MDMKIPTLHKKSPDIFNLIILFYSFIKFYKIYRIIKHYRDYSIVLKKYIQSDNISAS